MQTKARLLVALAAVLVTAGLAALVISAPRGQESATPGGDTGAAAQSPEPGVKPPSASGLPTPSGELSVSTTGWRTDFSRGSIDLGEIISGGPGKDGIPAIDDPQVESIAEARSWQSDEAPVIALEINGEARAYPLSILIWHEIANDSLGGVPVVVTFCPLCNTALVFERRLAGVTYDFGVSGNLRFSDLVMYDRQTESWWQQATGEAIVGELTATRLTFVPAQIVSLADFAATYPDAPVLSRDTGHPRDYGQNPYFGYDSVDQQPFLFRGELDGRLGPMVRVVTVKIGTDVVAYPYPDLAAVGAVNDVVGGMPIAVLWRPGVASPLDAAYVDEGRDIGATGVFDPNLDGRRLTLAPAEDGSIRDAETGSSWSISGLATDGPLAGKRLEPIVHGDHFWFAWAAFEPDTRIWTR